MKYIILILLSFLFTVSYSQSVTVKTLKTVTPSDTLTHEIVLSGLLTTPNQVYDIGIYILSTTTGNVKFAVAPTGLTYPIRSTSTECLATEKYWVRLITGYSLYYKSSATSGNSFTLNY